jgi:endo-1,4-beta-D-glucanase Y
MSAKHLALLATTTCAGLCLAAESHPFPQQLTLNHCALPAISRDSLNADVAAYYRLWKKAYIKPTKTIDKGYLVYSGGGTGADDNCVAVSEGMGFGMVATVLRAGEAEKGGDPEARTIFDGLLRTRLAYPSVNDSGLMAWQILVDSSGNEILNHGDDGATDGDLDIAYALLLAHQQWGSTTTYDYRGLALQYIAALKKYDWNPYTKLPLLGDWDSASVPGIATPEKAAFASRPSDWMVSHVRLFARETNDPFWDSAAVAMVATLNRFALEHAKKTGLVSDFVVGNNAAEPAPQHYLDEFKYTNEFLNNACRVPWRIGTDYALYGSADSKEWLGRVASWIVKKTKGDPANIGFGYRLKSGRRIKNWTSMAYTAPLCVAAMVDPANVPYVTKGWSLMRASSEGYYDDSINLLCMILMSGNWWK